MKNNRLRVVAVYDQVEASTNHCNNSCQHMAHPRASEPSAAACDLFDVPLVWDKRKKLHGYKRCASCKNSESLAEELRHE